MDLVKDSTWQGPLSFTIFGLDLFFGHLIYFHGLSTDHKKTISGFWSLISATLIFYSSLFFCSKFDNPDCTDPQNKIMVCAGKKKQFFVGQWLEKLCFQGLLQSLWTDTVQYHSKEVQRGWLSKWQSLYIINSYMRSQGEFPLASPSRRPRLSQGS